jgi:Domain of unknown function (DUF1330)
VRRTDCHHIDRAFARRRLALTGPSSRREQMSAYVIADIDVHDPETYREYTALVPGTLEPFGGRFLVRGGEHESL